MTVEMQKTAEFLLRAREAPRQKTGRPEPRRAFEILSPELFRAISQMEPGEREEIEEIRLRNGQPAAVFLRGREHILTREGRLRGREFSSAGIFVTSESIAAAVAAASNGVVYGAQESIREGYITVAGGHRLGICGHAVTENGRVGAIKNFSSLCLRIAKPAWGIGAGLASKMTEGGGVRSALVVSPPLRGKTTLLRDLARELSARGVRVGVADSRGELAGMVRGSPQFDIGPCSDVIEGCSKADGALILLRGMAPDVIIMDEITEEKDVNALLHAANCGVGVVASAHAESFEDLRARRVYRPLTEEKIFSLFAFLRIAGQDRVCDLYEPSPPGLPERE